MPGDPTKERVICMTHAALWMRQAAYATACAMILLLPAACATGSRGDFCAVYAPVYTSDADTTETRRQADVNNAVWMRFCEKK
jgi:hypothetical protein